MTNNHIIQKDKQPEGKLLRCIIVDDEHRARVTLKHLLAKYVPFVEVVAEAESVKSAVAAIRSNSPDVVFLDIEIIGGKGFDVLDQVKPYGFSVVFTTAYEKFGARIAGEPHSSVLYKPLDISELQRSVKKIRGSL